MKKISAFLFAWMLGFTAVQPPVFAQVVRIPGPGGTTAASGCSVTDNFANLTSFTVTMGSFAVSSNTVHGTGVGNYSLAYENTCAPTAIQHYQATWTSGGGNYMGVAVRLQTGSASGYLALESGASIVLQRLDSGANTNIGSCTGTVSTGQTFYISASGSNITVKANGVTICTATDATYAAGRVGIAAFDSGTTAVSSGSGGDGL